MIGIPAPKHESLVTSSGNRYRRQVQQARDNLRERKRNWRLVQLENERRRKKKRRIIAKLENKLATNSDTLQRVALNSRRSHASKTLLVSFCNVGDKTKPVVASINLCDDRP